jgi:predicted MFS family arabinose efflux permease
MSESLPHRTVIALIALGVLGRLVELVLPVFLESMRADIGYSNTSLGLIAGAELSGIIVSSIVLVPLLRGVSANRILFGAIIVFALANLACAFVSPAWAMAILRFLAGLLCEGPLLVIAVALLGQARGASRIYAAFMATQMTVGAIALLGLGATDTAFGFTGVAIGLSVVTLACLLALPFLPAGAAFPEAATGHASRIGAVVWSVLIAMGLFHLAISGAWAFLQQKGVQLGLSSLDSGGLLAVMMGSGILGAVYVARRETPRGLLLATCLIAALAMLGAFLSDGIVLFAASGITLMIAWNLSVPHQIALMGEDLGAARHLGFVPAAQGIGLAAGPALTGLLSEPGQYTTAAMLVIAAMIASLLLFYQGHRFRPA